MVALENAVSQYPKLEGRFPQVAGISFGFDPMMPPGSRVDPNLVRIGDEYLSPTQSYKLATKSFLYSGCDGYTVLKQARVLVSYSFLYVHKRAVSLKLVLGEYIYLNIHPK